MMIKPELIDNITLAKGDLPRHIVDISVNLILEFMTESLEKGERIEIRDFGSFNLKISKSRKARNPKTGKPTVTVDKTKIHFKPGKELKERVNASR